ncbi:MAG: hypothetical protein DCC68_26060 [Planctomycetota bacterium]|nr:MAG: hypothetical protein DCC68_26060 [Planctomycetota bacterium]
MIWETDAVRPVFVAVLQDDDDPFGEPVKPAEPPKEEEKKKEKPGENKEGESTEEPVEIVPLRPMVDPDTVKVYLGDGSVVTGKLTMQEITVETEFGQLKIPVTKILSFTPGLDSLPKLNERVAEAIEALGSNDFKTRDAAQRELLAMGVPVRAELQRHTGGDNAERVKRVREVIAKLDEMADDFEAAPQQAWARGDTVVTDEFTVVGKIGPQEFTFESKYGTLGVALADIRSLQREVGGGPTEIRKSLAVEGQYLASMRYKESKIRLQAGDKVTISAGGKIVMTPWGSNSSTGPDGNTRYGNMSIDGQNFGGGTLLAKVGSGKVFKVGSNHSFTADKAGELQFAIAIHPSYGRGEYSFPGQYDLKIRVNRSGQ